MSSRSSTLIAMPAAGSSATQQRLRLEDYLPYRLSVAANAVSGLIARAYVDRFGLTVPQWRLMAVLGEDSPLTQRALCARTVMDKVTVMRAARGLLRRRLLRRAPNTEDGRSHRLSLSATGERMYAEVAPLALRYEDLLLAGIEGGEIDRLQGSLRRLQQTAAALTASGMAPDR